MTDDEIAGESGFGSPSPPEHKPTTAVTEKSYEIVYTD